MESVRRVKDYLKFPNSLILDRRLSLGELGLMIHILDLANNAEMVDKKTLYNMFPNESKQDFDKWFGHLIEYGYIETLKVQEGED